MEYRLISINKETKEVMIGEVSHTKDNLRILAKKIQKEYICYIVDVLETFN